MKHATTILISAVTVLAETGARGLTHRAVDEHARLPTGTTSNYYRTRQQLVAAVVAHLLALDATRMVTLARHSYDSPGAFAAAFVAETLDTARGTVVARVALLSDPDAEALRAAREKMIDSGSGIDLLADLPRTALRMVLNFVDGVLQDGALYGAAIDRADLITAVDNVLAAYPPASGGR